MSYFKMLLPAAVIVAIAGGCEKNENPTTENEYSRGIYVINEGSFGANNGSISYYDPSKGVVTNNIFEVANGRPLGDVVQSFSVVRDTMGYIVVNNSSKLEIVELRTFKTLTSPIPVNYPRYFMQVSPDKGYLSAGSFEGYLYVINLNSFSKVDSIRVGYGPESMVLLNDMAYVANSGGWSIDSTISVVNTISNSVVDTIKVGKVPIDMVLDNNDNLWIYCKGAAIYDWNPPYNLISQTDAMLQKFSIADNNIIWQSKVGKAGDYTATPPKCTSSKDGTSILYLRPDGVYKISATTPVLQETPLIPGGYYGLEVNPSDGNIYVFESSFTGNGIMKIFDEDGNPIEEVVVGIAPNGAVFNPE